MARKAAHEIAKARWPQGRQTIWNAIQTLGKSDDPFSLTGIWEECGCEIPRDTVRDYVRSLTNGEFLTKVKQHTPRSSAEYKLTGRHGTEAPRVRPDGTLVTQGAGVEAMWRTIKLLGNFTAAELALTASTSNARITEETARSYVKYLKKAGYVRVVQAGTPGRNSNRARWSFVKRNDPGPKPPQIQRIKQLFDPNTNKVVWRDDQEGDA